jgi:hypothetical protein
MAAALLGLSLALLAVMGCGLFVLRARRALTVTPLSQRPRARHVEAV